MHYEKKAVIQHQKGLHTRVVAMVVQKAHELNAQYQSGLFFKYNQREQILANSLMLLCSLKVKAGDGLWVVGNGDNAELAVEEMVDFLESDFQLNNPQTINEVDKLLQDNAFTAEQVFNSMANGLMVCDEDDIITVFNPAAEEILGILASTVLGKKVYDSIPNSRLHIINKSGIAELACRQLVGDSVTITNRTPIMIDGQVKGAVAIFEDISALEKVTWELHEIKELKERLQLVLESVQDGICVLNKDGYITYVNPAYLRIVNLHYEDLVGKNINDISSNGARSIVLKSGKQVLGHVSHKLDGVTVVANVNPIIVDGELTGAVSVIKDITELHSLMDNLNRISAKAEYLEQELWRTKKTDSAFEHFIGRSGKVVDVLSMAAKAAQGSSNVLIRGESGTGKELVAEGIHYASSRAQGPFIRVNCGAIPTNLLESELFGHEKGSFTGAVRKKLGKFELANNGTIFLDEIGEMEKNMQVKLLRVLQKKEFERVGGEVTIKVNVRIIAATNQNLEVMVAQNEFREDLYYRLNVIPLLLPPLRERKEDIPLLAEHFMSKVSSELDRKIKGIKREALDILINYRWPGNVRELENIIERIVILTEGDYVDVLHLPSYIKEEVLTGKWESTGMVDDIILSWEEYEKKIIGKALKKYGSFNSAGKILGLTHKTVAAKARKYGLEKTISW
ncbi:sigma 54-interacting transcriptional regulator [Pelosinus sp. sgz500959]|uniref:sigma 54-interacting transcriptional regulator n=1 Tax=Pelosinus sp. sgz500959 TaxID=3242472 RepID=UPI00366D0475